jgi:hypothetical protein
MKNDRIAEWSVTRWLVGSSLLFLIPSLYAYTHNMKVLSIILVGTTFFSVNYWRKAEKGWRREADLYYAKFSFYTFVLLGVMYVRNIYYMFVGYIGLCVLVYCYQMSKHTHETKGPKSEWYKYHMLFHFIMTCEMGIILNSMIS